MEEYLTNIRAGDVVVGVEDAICLGDHFKGTVINVDPHPYDSGNGCYTNLVTLRDQFGEEQKIASSILKKSLCYPNVWETVKGCNGDWTVLVSQYSNKGPIILVGDGKNKELFRILYDTVTGKLRMLPANGGPVVEAEINF